MKFLQDLYRAHNARVWASCFDDRPGKLFDGLEHIRATIILNAKGPSPRCQILTTNLIRWPTETRPTLFPHLHYGQVTSMSISGSFPKASEPRLLSLLEKMWALPERVARVYDPHAKHTVHYYRSPLYWIRAMDFLPHFSSETARRSVHHFKDYPVSDPAAKAMVGCLINSTIFYIWFVAYGNGRNVTLRDIGSLPVPASLFSAKTERALLPLFKALMDDYRRHSKIRRRLDGVEFEEFFPGKSKHRMDQVDAELAPHFGLTPEELDYVINYDIKYRMGAESEGAEDE
jgi:hypothetical protein